MRVVRGRYFCKQYDKVIPYGKALNCCLIRKGCSVGPGHVCSNLMVSETGIFRFKREKRR